MFSKEEYKKLEEIDNFKKRCINVGYKHIYFDNWDIVRAIITNWYTIKYPANKIKILEEKYNDRDKIIFGLKDYKYSTVEQLYNYMGYTELMFRIPENLHPLIECWYTGEKTNGKLEGNIYLRNTNNRVEKHFVIDEYDGYLRELDSSFYGTQIKQNCPYISDFIKIINKETHIISEMTELVETHNLNLELRNLEFELIALTLLDSDKDKIVGYIRAKKFIEEFNEYLYHLNLSTTCIDNIDYGYIDNFNEKVTYILKELNKQEDNRPIEKMGLSFKTLKILLKKRIDKIEKLYNKSLYDLNTESGIYNIQIPYRDKKRLEKEISIHNIDVAQKKFELMWEELPNEIYSMNKGKDKTQKTKIFKKIFK